jgi:hypothetical protein
LPCRNLSRTWTRGAKWRTLYILNLIWCLKSKKYLFNKQSWALPLQVAVIFDLLLSE